MTVTELRLRTPEHRVSRTALLWWTLRALAFWLIVVGAQLAAWLLVPDPPAFLAWTWPITAVVGLAHVAVMPQWRYRVHRWETTADAVYTLTGWVNQEWRVAPVSRIQTVDTKRGPLQQLLGLATVTVTTASAAGPLAIAGLDHARAIRLVDELTETTKSVPGDAT